MHNVRPYTKLWVEREGTVVLSTWRVELLEAVDRAGSLSAAARQLRVPYRTAWSRLKEMEQHLGMKLLERHAGGPSGGYSELTAEGRQVVAKFHRVVAGVTELVDRRFRQEFGQR